MLRICHSPTSVSHSTGIIDMGHHTQLELYCIERVIFRQGEGFEFKKTYYLKVEKHVIH